jgi:hypothetical protein
MWFRLWMNKPASQVYWQGFEILKLFAADAEG